MTTIYFITNNYTLKKNIDYQKEIPTEQQRELLPLSFKGEKAASSLLKSKELLSTQKIYTSNYISMISTAKYLSEELDLPIRVDERLKERKVGILGTQTEQAVKEEQEHDFDYKLHNGESINMAKERISSYLKELLIENEEEVITIFTHDILLESLFSLWCEKGYNLENQLIMNFKDEVIIDGVYHPLRIFKAEFEETKLKKLSWLNQDQ